MQASGLFLQGVWGFILGGLTWFAIPFSLATTMGLAYLGMSSAQGAPLLTDHDVSSGLAAPLVAQKLLGSTGEYAILFLILMAVMSTGSAEVIAVASIIIYDIYQVIISKVFSVLFFGLRNLIESGFFSNFGHRKSFKIELHWLQRSL